MVSHLETWIIVNKKRKWIGSTKEQWKGLKKPLIRSFWLRSTSNYVPTRWGIIWFNNASPCHPCFEQRRHHAHYLWCRQCSSRLGNGWRSMQTKRPDGTPKVAWVSSLTFMTHWQTSSTYFIFYFCIYIIYEDHLMTCHILSVLIWVCIDSWVERLND